MPSITGQGFRLIINTRDERGHEPHAHVVKGRAKVKIALEASLTPYDVRNMSRRDIARARELVGANFGVLMKWWTEYNG
jgi:protein tyrosine phosphatase (PTP) superfamily phosphohydrolase (DUF442 family)